MDEYDKETLSNIVVSDLIKMSRNSLDSNCSSKDLKHIFKDNVFVYKEMNIT